MKVWVLLFIELWLLRNIILIGDGNCLKFILIRDSKWLKFFAIMKLLITTFFWSFGLIYSFSSLYIATWFLFSRFISIITLLYVFHWILLYYPTIISKCIIAWLRMDLCFIFFILITLILTDMSSYQVTYTCFKVSFLYTIFFIFIIFIMSSFFWALIYFLFVWWSFQNIFFPKLFTIRI